MLSHFRAYTTRFFTFSPDSNHPSRLIAVDADDETVDDIFPFDSEPMSPEQYNAAYPLYACIRDTNGEYIVQKIQAFHEVDDSSLHVRDNLGFTPVLVAALKSDTNAIRKLLALDV